MAVSNALRARARRLQAVSAVVCAIALSGCGRGDELARLHAAKQRLAEGEARAAAIELASLVQARPESTELRVLLGRALLATGEAAAAETHLRRAWQTRSAPPEVDSLLASAMLAQGKSKALVAEFTGHVLGADAHSAELATMLAFALADLGRLDAAEDTIASQLERSPEHVPTAVMQGRILAARRDFAGAQAHAQRLAESHPTHALVLTLVGDLAVTRGDMAAALEAYRKALQADARLMPAHSGLMTVLIRENDIDAASRQFGEMHKALPGKAETLYLEAVLAQIKGDPKRARELAQLLLTGSPSNTRLLMLASLAEIQLGGPSSAERLLEKAISIEPEGAELRRLLAHVLIQGGKSERALEVLRPLLQGESVDVEAMTIAAQAHLVAGDVRQSERHFSRAAAIRPEDPDVRAALGRAYLARGQVEPGLRELQAAAAADRRGVDADLALIGTRMRRGELDAAAKSLDALAAKQPTQALPEHLRGHLALLRRDPAGARTHFERAIARDPTYFPSVARLADLDMAENQPDRARSRYEALLQIQADHVGAMFALATHAQRAGRPAAESTAWLDKAVRIRPKDVETWAAAIDHRLQAGDGTHALALARAATQALPEPLEIVERLGLAQVAAGEARQGIETLTRLQKALPTSPRVLLLLAEANLAAGDSASAQMHAHSALAIAPDRELVQRRTAATAMKRGRADDAIGIAREVQTREPMQALGWRLEGDAEAMRKNWDASASAFRLALGKKSPGDAAVRLHWALTSGGKAQEASRFEQGWLKDHPTDARFVLHLGERAMLSSDWAGAEARFRRVLELEPEHPFALNNLAYLLAKGRKPGALPLAERAARIMPESPEILDTLAMVLAAEGHHVKAIDWQKRALALAPNSGGLRLNLARLYLGAGDRDNARKALQDLAQLGTSFSAHEEVARLLKEL